MLYWCVAEADDSHGPGGPVDGCRYIVPNAADNFPDNFIYYLFELFPRTAFPLKVYLGIFCQHCIASSFTHCIPMLVWTQGLGAGSARFRDSKVVVLGRLRAWSR